MAVITILAIQMQSTFGAKDNCRRVTNADRFRNFFAEFRTMQMAQMRYYRCTEVTLDHVLKPFMNNKNILLQGACAIIGPFYVFLIYWEDLKKYGQRYIFLVFIAIFGRLKIIFLLLESCPFIPPHTFKLTKCNSQS